MLLHFLGTNKADNEDDAAFIYQQDLKFLQHATLSVHACVLA